MYSISFSFVKVRYKVYTYLHDTYVFSPNSGVRLYWLLLSCTLKVLHPKIGLESNIFNNICREYFSNTKVI